MIEGHGMGGGGNATDHEHACDGSGNELQYDIE